MVSYPNLLRFDTRETLSYIPRLVLCQSIRQRPPDIGTQNSRFCGVPRA